MVNETVKGNKRLYVKYVVWHEWKCMSVYIILLLIKDISNASCIRKSSSNSLLLLLS